MLKNLLAMLTVGSSSLLAACSSGVPLEADEVALEESASAGEAKPAPVRIEENAPAHPGEIGAGLDPARTVIHASMDHDATLPDALDPAVAARIRAACGAGSNAVINAEGAIFCLRESAASEVGAGVPAPSDVSSLQAEPPGVMSGTYYMTIPAITCTPAFAGGGLRESCSGGNTLRTDGDASFPCAVHSNPQRETYVCHLPLPSGAVIEEILAFGLDWSPSAYMEAALWRTADTTFGPEYVPPYGGSWRNSGVPFQSGTFSFAVYPNVQPHTVAAGYRYTIGFALKDAPNSSGSVTAYGFRVRYSI